MTVPVLLGICTLSFAIIHVAPGGAAILLVPRLRPAHTRLMEHQVGLDAPRDRRAGLQGHPEDARQAYRDALTVIDGVAAALKDESLWETFLTSPHVRHIHELAM